MEGRTGGSRSRHASAVLVQGANAYAPPPVPLQRTVAASTRKCRPGARKPSRRVACRPSAVPAVLHAPPNRTTPAREVARAGSSGAASAACHIQAVTHTGHASRPQNQRRVGAGEQFQAQRRPQPSSETGGQRRCSRDADETARERRQRGRGPRLHRREGGPGLNIR